MAKKTMTVQQLLAKAPDEKIMEMYEELECSVVPTTSACRKMIKQVNRMIDQGILCINPSTYRKIYLPSLARLVYAEMAMRYAWDMRHKFEVPDHMAPIDFDKLMEGGQVIWQHSR